MEFHVFTVSVKLLVASLALIALGVSQIIYAWAGDGFVPKYIYPNACFLMAIVVGYVGYHGLFGKSDEE